MVKRNRFIREISYLFEKSDYRLTLIIFNIARAIIKRIVVIPLSELLGVCLYLILSLLWPFQKIRFCGVFFGRIGHLVGNTDVFIRRMREGLLDDDCIYIGCNILAMNAANEQVLKMYKRNIPIVESKFFGRIINSRATRNSKYYEFAPTPQRAYYEFNSLPPILRFTENEERLGTDCLGSMGITGNDWFVCFHTRDKGYLSKTEPVTDYSYHDCRDCDINHYIAAMEYIADQGGYAIVMGAHPEKKLEGSPNPRIIDYASKHRTDFMDIYLSAKCKFFVACTAGLLNVPQAFNVPIAAANIIPVGESPKRHGDLFIHKKIRNIAEDRLLSYREIFEGGIHTWYFTELYQTAGLDVVENSPDEILGIVREMNERLDGKFILSAEDEELYLKYDSLILPGYPFSNSPAMISATFLREMQSLLN